MVGEIQKAITSAEFEIKNSSAPLVKFQEATLTLQTTMVKSVDGKVELVVFSIGAEGKSEITQTITMTLLPTEVQKVAAQMSIADNLKVAIVEAVKGVAKANQSSVPLALKDLTVSFEFELTTNASGGLSFDVLPVKVSAGGSVTKTNGHSIVLKFIKI